MCGGEKPAGLLTSRGEVWFPSSKGPVRIRIDQPEPSDRAPALIDQVVADGLQISPSSGISLGPDTAKVELHYGVVLLRSQERIRFRYRLDGFDRTWSEATADRVAHYTNLPAGRYTFRAAAFEMNNPEAIAEAVVDIVQRPHFYRTAWFMTLCVLCLAGVVWSIHKFRLQQLRGRFQAVLIERNRLAREMHDTVIQGCVSVSALLEAHLSLGHADADAKQDLLGCARTQLRATIDEAREAIGNLRHSAPPLADLTPLLQKMATDLSQEFGVPVECVASGRSFEFQQDTIHELLMVVREAIYNAVRHGRPSAVTLEIEFGRNSCSVRILDDGMGFEPAHLASLPVGHYGLVGMRERVQRIGGKLVLNSRSGAGTEVRFQIPKRATLPSDEKETHVGI